MLCAAVPIGFGVLRAINTGTDFRYLWTALGALAGAFVVTTIAKARATTRLVAEAAVAFFVSTLLAVCTGALLGVRASSAGLWVVSVSFAFWSAVSSAFFRLSTTTSVGVSRRSGIVGP